MPESHERPPQLGAKYEAFWPIFENSRFPMALMDSERRYVAVNDVIVAFFKLPREELVGSQPGRTMVAQNDQAAADAEWEILVNTGEVYSDRVFEYADGRRLRLRYAAHASTASGSWLAFVVILSARLQPDGSELIAPAAASEPDSPPPGRPRLTRREREIVRLVALGAGTREVAERLYLSPETVRSHVRNAMSKTSARTRAQLVATALSERLLED
jgi:DNA-binding CsgD family transcriptional regulator